MDIGTSVAVRRSQGNSLKAHHSYSRFQNYDCWATDNLSRPGKNRLQVVFAELCKNFTFSKSQRYFLRLDFEALSKSLITVIIVFAARDSEVRNEKNTD